MGRVFIHSSKLNYYDFLPALQFAGQTSRNRFFSLFLYLHFFIFKLIIMKSLTTHGMRTKLFFVLLLSLFFSCKKSDQLPGKEGAELSSHDLLKPAQESADIVYQWYRFMSTLQQPVNPQPVVFVQNRAYAYIGIGLFEAVQPGITGGSSFSPKLYQMPAMPKPDKSKVYSWRASANAALCSLFKSFLASLSVANKASIDAHEAAIRSQLQLTVPADVLQRSEEFGRSIATAIFNWASSDNFSIASTTYIQSTTPWAWVPTPPAFAAPVAADLQYSRPLLKYSLTATAPPIPIPYSTVPNSAFFNAAKEVHDLGGTVTATAAQKATANWWADAGGAGTGVPAPYHILSIVTTVLESKNSGLWKAAEVYAKTGIGLKDGPINTFRAKYQYSLLRPITYIRAHMDPNWLSHLPNPPYPDYTSGLVSNYGPVIQVLIKEFGDIPVTDNTYGWRGLPARHYNSLSEMLEEASVSRVYAGIHYRFTQDISITMGKQLGDEIDKITVVGPQYQ